MTEQQEINDGGPVGLLTQRDYFAAKALQAILPSITMFPDEHWRVGVALDCYDMADAMLIARSARVTP